MTQLGFFRPGIFGVAAPLVNKILPLQFSEKANRYECIEKIIAACKICGSETVDYPPPSLVAFLNLVYSLHICNVVLRPT